MNKKIAILIVNYNTSDFIINTLYCLEKITYFPYEIFIVDNFYSPEEKERIKKICARYNNVNIFFRKQSMPGAIGHGEALDFLTQKVKTPYFSILDADATWLKKYWDKILISKINKKIKIVGSQAPLNQTKKPIDFPLMFAALFETKSFKNLNVHFKPENQERAHLGEDTGHQLRNKYLEANKSGMLLNHVYSINKKDSPFYKIGCAEYHSNKQQELFASHFWRGSSLTRTDNVYLNNKKMRVIRKIPLFGESISRLLRKQEKNKWLKICQEIVNSQI